MSQDAKKNSVIKERIGDIFNCPTGSVLIHACNCVGSWGGGVALTFKHKFPAAFKFYSQHCRPTGLSDAALTAHQSSLRATTLLIPPQAQDITRTGTFWIACVFTSVGYKFALDSQPRIVSATESCLDDLANQLRALQRDPNAVPFGKLYAVRINFGLFEVPWHITKAVLERGPLNMTILVRQQDINPAESFGGDGSESPEVGLERYSLGGNANEGLEGAEGHGETDKEDTAEKQQRDERVDEAESVETYAGTASMGKQNGKKKAANRPPAIQNPLGYETMPPESEEEAQLIKEGKLIPRPVVKYSMDQWEAMLDEAREAGRQPSFSKFKFLRSTNEMEDVVTNSWAPLTAEQLQMIHKSTEQAELEAAEKLAGDAPPPAEAASSKTPAHKSLATTKATSKSSAKKPPAPNQMTGEKGDDSDDGDDDKPAPALVPTAKRAPKPSVTKAPPVPVAPTAAASPAAPETLPGRARGRLTGSKNKRKPLTAKPKSATAKAKSAATKAKSAAAKPAAAPEPKAAPKPTTMPKAKTAAKRKAEERHDSEDELLQPAPPRRNPPRRAKTRVEAARAPA